MSERWDDLMVGGYKLLQDTQLFCFGMDAVLLSNYIRLEPNESVIDICTGNGVIPILLAAKTKSKHIVGLEIQSKLIELANKSVIENNLSDRVSFIEGDVRVIEETVESGTFDVISMNPPYMTNKHGIINEKESLAIARHEILCSLDDCLSAANKVLKTKGRLYMVHRPFRLAEIFYKMQSYGIEPKRMRMVYPFINKEPNMVLIEGIKGGRPRIMVERPLIVYESEGVYTKDIKDIYGI